MWRQFDGYCESLTHKKDVSDIGNFGRTVLQPVTMSIDIFIIGTEATVKLNEYYSNRYRKFKLKVISLQETLILLPISSAVDMHIILSPTKNNGYIGIYYIPSTDDKGNVTVNEMDQHKMQAQAAI